MELRRAGPSSLVSRKLIEVGADDVNKTLATFPGLHRRVSYVDRDHLAFLRYPCCFSPTI